jgi:hypothetical protein
MRPEWNTYRSWRDYRQSYYMLVLEFCGLRGKKKADWNSILTDRSSISFLAVKFSRLY